MVYTQYKDETEFICFVFSFASSKLYHIAKPHTIIITFQQRKIDVKLKK